MVLINLRNFVQVGRPNRASAFESGPALARTLAGALAPRPACAHSRTAPNDAKQMSLDGLKRLVSPRSKERLKALMGALGHRPGWAQRVRARRYATGMKRLDHVAAWFLPRLRQAGIESLRGARVMEFGAGHLLSEPIICWLAGASHVEANDYFPILQPGEIGRSVASADLARLESLMDGWGDPAERRARLDALLGGATRSLAGLERLGIVYVAPLDLSRPHPEPGSFDLINSLSVLEHVPPAAAPAILANLHAALAPGGRMIHNIHLEDHRDFENAPFAFLAADSDYREGDADARGNRLRASDWLAMAEALPGAEVTVNLRAERDVALLPRRLDPLFAGRDPRDLATGGLDICITRRR